MPKKIKYNWSNLSDLPTLEAHSITKHEVLRAYLSRYFEVLNSDPRIPHFKVFMVDGFCGGGLYTHELTGELSPGSPIIILDTIQNSEIQINKCRDNDFKIIAKYYFVDDNPYAIDFLKNHLLESGYADRLRDVTFLRGKFTDHAPAILDDIDAQSRSARAIFTLDQYGYKDVPTTVIRQIIKRLPHAEIVLTIATDWIFDYMNDSPSFKKTLREIGLNSLADISAEETKKQQSWRFLAQKYLSESLRLECGAKFYTPFFIKSNNSNRSYWLVHMSNHARARDEMIQVHWQLKNHFIHHGASGLNMLGYDPSKDELVTGQVPLFIFDEQAKEASLNALTNDIPKWVHNAGKNVTFGDIISNTSNTTPASLEMMQKALYMQADSKELIIETPKGSTRRSSHQIKFEDKIIINPQRRFHFT